MSSIFRRSGMYCRFALPVLCAFLCCVVFCHSLSGQVLRMLDIPDLSNNAVLYMHQDRTGNMWFGTYDGLNQYNGKSTFVYRYELGNKHSIDGNIIRKVADGGPDHIWVSTMIGMNRISLSDKKVVESYPQYPEAFIFTSDSLGHTLLVSLNDFISYHSPETGAFQDIYVPGVASIARELFTDKKEDSYLLTANGLLRRLELNTNTLPVSLKMYDTPLHTLEIKYASHDKEEDVLFFLDITDKLYEYDCGSKRKKLIADISHIHQKYANVSRILRWKSEIYISYINNGLVKINKDDPSGKSYTAVEIKSGVFSLCKDRKQDILWLGTDGQGVSIYYEEDRFFEVLDLVNLPGSTQKPVRGIYTDDDCTLWIGTKGDGVFRIDNYKYFDNKPLSRNQVSRYTTNDGLPNNQVFCFQKSKSGDALWMGSDGPGLSYYSYKDKKIHLLEDNNIRRVHSICEINDTTLWLATAGYGLIKIILDKSTTPIKIKGTHVSSIKKRLSNNLHSMIFDGDSSLIVGVRGGHGAVRFNIYSEEHTFFSLEKEGVSSAIGDVLCVYPANDSLYYLGASSGLTLVGSDVKKQFSKKDGLANDMIHGILEDNAGCLWLSTNQGLTRYNPSNDQFHNYRHKDLIVSEFSDDSFWKCPYTGRLFFGGINGLVWLDPDMNTGSKYKPDLRFLDATVGGKILDLSSLNGDLVIPPGNASFKISFVATDYINGDNYDYSYKLDGYDASWNELQKNNEVMFINLPYGKYKLRVKYKDDVFEEGRKEYELPIHVKPPWYLTGWALGIYVVLVVLVVLAIVWVVQARWERKKKALSRKIKEEQKEKLYEAKLNFFTNITHELCTPLTLINGVTENISDLKPAGAEEAYRKNIEVLQDNVKELNGLIQEILDFRKIEESGFVDMKIKKANITEFVRIQNGLFQSAIEKGGVGFRLDVSENLFWNTDISFLKKIYTNLMSNALKYVSENGEIRVSVSRDAGNLELRVYNTGQGIEEGEIRHLFDRFHILEHLGENKYMQASTRNGLGLFICYSLVNLLKGDIRIESEVGQYAEFIVTFPELMVKDEWVESEAVYEEKESEKPLILVVDDNKDIVWLISNALNGEYEIKQSFSADEALKSLKQHTPELIITDIMMPGMDGLELLREIKSNKYTKHIPVIIISAKISDREQADGLNLGAEAYLTKPFSSLVLQSTVNRILSTKNALKEYYYSPESAYELAGGQLLHQEDKNFMESVTTLIQENLDKETLRPEWLAGQLGLSPRNLYRRFKKISPLSPSDFIKDYRFTYAARLLVTTNLSIQEIIYKVGISNKSYFYREFSAKYQQTPKEYRTAGRKHS